MTTENKSLLDELKQLDMSMDEFEKLQQMGISLDDIKHLHTTVLWNTIQRKLKQRQRQSNIKYLLGVLTRLANEKMRPSSNDKITNPLATDTRVHPAYSDVAGKRALYNTAVEIQELAYTDSGATVPLGAIGAEFNDVEYIGGLWRVQKVFPYEITDVRGRQFVLLKKLPHTEKTRFEFYSAAGVIWGANGASANINKPDWIVAKYETPHGTYMAYGQTIEQARAFLGIKMYDEYQDLIHSAAFADGNHK